MENKNNKKNSTEKHLERACKNCGDTWFDHYGPILNPYKNKENERKMRPGVCAQPDCNCENYEPIEEVRFKKIN